MQNHKKPLKRVIACLELRLFSKALCHVLVYAIATTNDVTIVGGNKNITYSLNQQSHHKIELISKII